MNLALFAPRSRFDVNLTLLGFPLRIAWTFWLVVVLFSWQMRGLEFILASMALIVVSIWVHEMGHALAARSCGQQVDEIILYALGGLCVYSGGWLSPRKDIWISFAGPAAGFALCAISGVLLFTIGMQTSALVYFFLYNGFWMNLFINGMNLLPVFPLDGGQILKKYAAWKWNKDDLFVLRVSMITALFAAGVLIAGVIMLKWDAFGVIVFLALAGNSWYLMYQMNRMGISSLSMTGGGDDDEPRQPWERDPDWWKKG